MSGICQHEGCTYVASHKFCAHHRPSAIAFRANLDDHRHGTRNGYSNLQCRCAPCTDAFRVAMIAYSHDPERGHERRERARLREVVKRHGVDANRQRFADAGLVRASAIAHVLARDKSKLSRSDLRRIPHNHEFGHDRDEACAYIVAELLKPILIAIERCKFADLRTLIVEALS